MLKSRFSQGKQICLERVKDKTIWWVLVPHSGEFTSVTFDDVMRVATTIKADITLEAAKRLWARPTAASMKEGS